MPWGWPSLVPMLMVKGRKAVRRHLSNLAFRPINKLFPARGPWWQEWWDPTTGPEADIEDEETAQTETYNLDLKPTALPEPTPKKR